MSAVDGELVAKGMLVRWSTRSIARITDPIDAERARLTEIIREAGRQIRCLAVVRGAAVYDRCTASASSAQVPWSHSGLFPRTPRMILRIRYLLAFHL
jgi:hypothetical protein